MEAGASAEVLLGAAGRLLGAAGLLLVPCVALLCCCLTALLLLLLLRRPRRRPPAPAARCPRQQQQPPWLGPEGAAGGSAAGLGGRPSLLQRCLCGRAPASSTSSSSPLAAPPNSPAGSWLARGVPESTFGRQPSSVQRKALSGSRSAFPACLHPSPLEYGSSIRRGEKWTQLSSANLTASQGPGMDSDFGASAGVSLRILSSDSEESPTAPLWHPQQSGRFEWDYYDPSYKRSPPLQRHLPCVCSKQYWL